MNATRGQLLIVSAPSGAGKTSLIKALMDQDDRVEVSVSHTTRPQRPGETEGVNYFFVSTDTFNEMRDAGAFFEFAEVFGHLYGTSLAQLEARLSDGADVILEIDWQGAQQLREKMREDIVSVFILPPSKKELERRLKERGQDTDEVVKERMSEATAEITHWAEYDYVIINEDLNLSVKTVLGILHSERMKRIRQIGLGEFVRSISLDN